jgi:hypothetical protein
MEGLIEPAGASGVAHAAMQSKNMRDKMSAPADVMNEDRAYHVPASART